MKISIVIPAYNEEKRIGNTLEKYGEYYTYLKNNEELDFEIIVVINNTRDKTEEVVRYYEKKYQEIRYLNFIQGGKGFAIIEGFKDALKRKNDLIGFVDADMATSPESYYWLIKHLRNHQGSIANRWDSRSRVTKRTFVRKITSKGFNFVVRSLFLMPYRDTQCGAKIFKAEVIEKIINQLNLTEWAFDINLLYLCRKNNFRIKQIPTIWEDQINSKLNDVPKASLQMFLGVVRLRLINSIFEPLLRPIKFILRFTDKLINKNG